MKRGSTARPCHHAMTDRLAFPLISAFAWVLPAALFILHAA